MPKRKQRFTNAQFGGLALFEEPQIAIYLAVVANAWTQIEAYLSEFIAYMITEPYLKGRKKKTDPVAKSIFGALQTFNQRVGLMVAVLDARLTPRERNSAYKRKLGLLRKKLSAASKLRAEVVHSIWGHSKRWPGYLIKSTPHLLAEQADSGNPVLVSAEELHKIALQIQGARDALAAFELEIKSRPKGG